MKCRFRVVHLKGDWSEFCTTLGFPNWNSSMRPCLKCNAHPGNMFDFGAASPLSLPWVSTTQADYLAACQRCEVLVTLRNALQRDQILAVLAYDKRPTGARGRALTEAIPAMGLLVGDRLEPSAGLRDIGGLELLATFPADIVFWRRGRESVALHRNPLFSGTLGIDVISVDSLHTLHLGVMQTYLCNLCWALFHANAWHHAGSFVQRVQLSVMSMRNELWGWHSGPENRTLTRCGDLTPEMFGSDGHRKLRMKGAETWSFMLFSQFLLLRHSTSLADAGPAWVDAGNALVQFVRCCKRNGRRLEAAAVQDAPRTPQCGHSCLCH